MARPMLVRAWSVGECVGVVRGAGRHGSVACRVAQRAQPGAFRFVFTLVNGGIDPF